MKKFYRIFGAVTFLLLSGMQLQAASPWTTVNLVTNAAIVYYAIAANGPYVHAVYDSTGGIVGYKRSTDEGATFAAEVNLATGSPYLDHAIVADETNVFVIYVKNIQTKTDWCCPRLLGDIYFKSSRDNGTTWGSETKISTTNTAYRVGMSAQGTNIAIVWMAYKIPSAGATTWDVNLRQSLTTGTSWLSETQLVAGAIVASANKLGAERPSVRLDGSNIHVAWMDGAQWPLTNTFEIFYKRSADLGSTWTTNTCITTNLDANGYVIPAGRPDLGLSTNLLLSTFEHPISNISGNHPFITKSADGGTNWTHMELGPGGETEAGWGGHPSVATDGWFVHVPWWDARQAPGGTTRAIWYRLSPDGGANFNAEEQLSTATIGTSVPMVAASFATNHYAHVIWSDPSTGNNILKYARRLVSEDDPGGPAVNYYVDPDWGGPQFGTTNQPWASMNSARWAAIDTALSMSDVNLYFSALKANATQQSQAIFLAVQRSNSGNNRLTIDGYSCYNTSISSPVWIPNPNLNIANAYTNGQVFKLTGDGSDALGWERVPITQSQFVTNSIGVFCCIRSHTSGAGSEPGIGSTWTNYWNFHTNGIATNPAWVTGTAYRTWVKQDNITIRGFETTGVSARFSVCGDNVISDYIYVHDITAQGAAVTLHYTSHPDSSNAVCAIIASHPTNIVFRNMVVADTYGEGFYLGGINPSAPLEFQRTNGWQYDGILVSNVAIIRAGANGAQGDGIDCKNGILNLHIVDCNIDGYNGAGIIPPLQSTNLDGHTIIERTLIHDNRLDLGQGSGRAIRVVTDGSLDASMYGIFGLTIRNCSIYKNADGISIFGSTGHPVNGVQIYNNTVYWITNNSGITLFTQIQNSYVSNNFVFASGTPTGLLAATGVSSDYNAHDSTWTAANEGSHTATFAFTEAQARAQIRNTNNPPDLQLITGSALIDAGATLTSFSDDARGVARPQLGSWDIGAYEYTLPQDVGGMIRYRRHQVGRVIR